MKTVRFEDLDEIIKNKLIIEQSNDNQMYVDFECIFASNKYHPTADLSLQKSDFIEESSYYNSEIHTASFMLHAHAKRELLGVCKN